MKINKTESFKKLEKVNPSKAYYLDLIRRGNIQLLEFPYFLGILTLFIGFLIRVYSWFIGWGMMIFGGFLFIISVIFMIYINKKYRDILSFELMKEKIK